MIDDIDDIKEYYDAGYDETRRLDRHQLERDMTFRYFTEYLPREGRILEIGAASGAYTIWLAQRGYHVTAVDVSEKLLENCRCRVDAAGLQNRVVCVLADARDLSAVQRRNFDAALVMGPLYHLVVKEERLIALHQAADRLRPGGICLTSHISRYGIFGQLMQAVPGWIESQRHVRSLIESGCEPEDGPLYGFRAYYATVNEIAPLHEEAGLETIAVVGVEPSISADDRSYNILQGKSRELWLDLLYELSRNPALIAGSRHLLYIGRKPRE